MDALELNRKHWDELARIHGQDRYYDVDAFLAGGTSLHERELEVVESAIGPVRGIELLHIQCHFGLDTLSWARLGAKVTGVDFSRVAVERARALARTSGLQATFLEADSQDLPAELTGNFGVAFASYGVLCWIADLGGWMRSAWRALRLGGKLVLVELHPLFNMLASVEPPSADFPYQGGLPQRVQGTGSYADPDAHTQSPETIEYAHGLGEVVSAAVRAGFILDELTEFTDEAFDPRGGLLIQDEDGRYRLPLTGEALPVTYALVATKEGELALGRAGPSASG